MLGRKFRLKRLEIEETIKKGVSFNIFFVCIKALKISSRKDNGFSIIISKKNEKTSVGRHKIKRTISSIIENNNFHKKELKFNAIVIILKQKTTPINIKDFKEGVLKILNNLVV